MKLEVLYGKKYGEKFESDIPVCWFVQMKDWVSYIH